MQNYSLWWSCSAHHRHQPEFFKDFGCFHSDSFLMVATLTCFYCWLTMKNLNNFKRLKTWLKKNHLKKKNMLLIFFIYVCNVNVLFWKANQENWRVDWQICSCQCQTVIDFHQLLTLQYWLMISWSLILSCVFLCQTSRRRCWHQQHFVFLCTDDVMMMS